MDKRLYSVSGPSVNFDSDMVLKLKKDVFLSNTANKQQLINLLGEKLQLSGCNIIHAPGDADLMIVQMAVQSAKSITTLLVRDDTDVIVLLCHHADTSARDLFFIPQPKQRSTTRKIREIKKTKAALGPETCANNLFVHAVLGCDTTSGIHGIGKGNCARRVHNFRSKLRFLIMKMPQRVILLQLERKPLFVYAMAGLTKVWIRYDIRDSTRRSQQGLLLYSPNVFLRLLQPLSTIPSGFTTRYSSGEVLRSRHKNWGWKLVDGRLLPVRTNLPAAHVSLLEIIRCNCKSEGGSQRCSCRKHGMDCSAAYGFCRGQSCTNSASPDLSENDQ